MLLWSGQLVSWLGTEITSIALPLVVLALTGSPAQAGVAAAIKGVAYLVWALPAGVLVDRWNRKRVMFYSNLGSGLAMLVVALALASHTFSLPLLYLACALEGSCFVFANLARFACFPQVVSREQFPAAAAQTATADNLAFRSSPSTRWRAASFSSPCYRYFSSPWIHSLT